MPFPVYLPPQKGGNIVHIAAQYSLECLKVLQSSHHLPSDLFQAIDKVFEEVQNCHILENAI